MRMCFEIYIYRLSEPGLRLLLRGKGSDSGGQLLLRCVVEHNPTVPEIHTVCHTADPEPERWHAHRAVSEG